jgi:hypothetical protein
MSRTHDRAYALLSERMQLRAPMRHALYAILGMLLASGVAWIAVHYEGDLQPEWRNELRQLTLEAWAMKLHGGAAIVTLVAIGMMLAHHVRRGWALARNRWSGSVVVAAFALLTLTGYALYYVVNDATRTPVSMTHWLVGLALAPLFIVHIVLGRRSRTRQTW